MLWVGVVVLGSIFGFEILEKKWWDLSKEEERRRGSELGEVDMWGLGYPKGWGWRWAKGKSKRMARKGRTEATAWIMEVGGMEGGDQRYGG